jgi:hypothetical protein
MTDWYQALARELAAAYAKAGMLGLDAAYQSIFPWAHRLPGVIA